MRPRFWWTVTCLAVLAAGSGWYVVRDLRLAEACAQHAELSWLRIEFGLDDHAIGKIDAIQRRFEVECAVHCTEISEAKAALRAHPDAAAKARWEVALRRCEGSRREHVLAIAGCMSAEKAKVYINLIMPKVEAMSHEGAPDLQGRPPAR